MKKIALISLICFILPFAVVAQDAKKDTTVKKNKNAPQILFEKTVYDFGNIPYQSDGTCEFAFKNTGKEPLILTNCRSSCGCTVPDWPKTPINKKQSGSIKVKYNTSRVGPFQKTITVISNAGNGNITLTIKGTVAKPDEVKTTPFKEESIPANSQQNK